MSNVKEDLFQESVKRGVETLGDNRYKFFDPGLSLLSLCDLDMVKENHLVHLNDSILKSRWINQPPEAKERTLIIPVLKLFEANMSYQQARMDRKYGAVIPTTSTLLALLLLHRIQHKKWIMDSLSVRTSD